MITTVLFATLISTSGKAEFTNPVWGRDFPDPYIVQDGKTFFAFATHNSSAGFQVMSSEDLVNWKHLGGVNVPDWSDDQLWAPEVYKWKGKWYMFYSARDRQSRKRDLAVSVADSPKGPYKFVAKLIPGESENPGTDGNGAIDPNIYVEKGKPYLLYVREARPRSIKMVELTPDFTKTVGSPKVLIGTDREVEKGVLDAPTLIKHQGAYWLFYSSGWFQSYKRDACYQVWAAKSSSLMGAYAKPEEPILKTKEGETYLPGHQHVFKLASGEWWMAYHAWDSQKEPLYNQNSTGRTLRIDPLKWTTSGPSMEGPTIKAIAQPRIK